MRGFSPKEDHTELIKAEILALSYRSGPYDKIVAKKTSKFQSPPKTHRQKAEPILEKIDNDFFADSKNGGA